MEKTLRKRYIVSLWVRAPLLPAISFLATALRPLFGAATSCLGNVTLHDFFDLLFRHGPDDLVGNLPALENQKRWDATDIKFARGVNVLVHVELHDFQLARMLARDFFHRGR